MRAEGYANFTLPFTVTLLTYTDSVKSTIFELTANACLMLKWGFMVDNNVDSYGYYWR